MRLAVAAAMMLATGPGWAAAPRLISTTMGKDAPIGVYAVVRRDCSVGAAPEIRITRGPAHGTIVLQDLQFAVERTSRCAPGVVPAREVIYRPAANFSGQDEVSFELVDRDTGQSDPHLVTIVVQPAPSGI